MKEVLGVDFGGVICARKKGKENLYEPIEGVFKALERLRKERFGNKIFIISYAPPDLQKKVVNWIFRERLFARTGIPPTHLEFCRQREHKGPICERIGITHFIDDRMEIMEALVKARVPNLFLFQGREDEIAPRAKMLEKVQRVESWTEVQQKLLV